MKIVSPGAPSNHVTCASLQTTPGFASPTVGMLSKWECYLADPLAASVRAQPGLAQRVYTAGESSNFAPTYLTERKARV